MENKNIVGRIHTMPDDEESRKVIFIASTSDKDRHGTVVNQAGWNLDNFNANPITGYQHNVYGGGMCSEPNPDDVLGPARAWVENDELLVEIDFETKDLNPLADKIFRKVKNGSLRAVSVGFSEVGKGHYGEGEEAREAPNETYYFEGQELLEISVVNIPSNRQALKKSFRASTANAISWLARELGADYTYAQIGNLTVNEISELLQARENNIGKSITGPNPQKVAQQIRKQKQTVKYLTIKK